MNILNLPQLPNMFYQAFVRDGRRLYRLLPSPLRRGFWGVFITQLVFALTETFTLLVISLFVVSVTAPEMALNNFMVRGLLSVSPPLAAWCAEPRHLVGLTSLLMAVFIFLKVGFSSIMVYTTSLFAESVSLYIGRETLRRYLHKSYYWHISPESAEVIHKFGQRVDLSHFLVSLLLLYSNVICCLALFSSLFLAKPKLTALVITLFGVGSLGTYLSLRRRLDQAGLKTKTLALAESAERLILTQGLREVLLYRRQDIFFQQMTDTMAQLRPVRVFLAFAGYLPASMLELIGFATIALLTIGLLAWGAAMPFIVSSISMLMLTAWRVLPAVSRALGYTVTLRSMRPLALTCLELLENFITRETEPLPEPAPDFHFERDITLRDASFRYPGDREPALFDLNLTIKRGEKVGLIGLSGAGKSTLALLLTGVVKPQAGRFLIDGRELSPADLAAYIRLVGLVPQNPLLLPGTVADNVAFSKWGEPYDRQATEAACRQAAMDFVFDHPQGLDRPLGTGGQGLSGGQTQRVAIARAIFARPEIIVFDEATSSLDQGGEKAIAETIGKFSVGTTVIIIAHRLSTVESCERLVWLEKGRVKTEGSPAKILPIYLAATAEKNKE